MPQTVPNLSQAVLAALIAFLPAADTFSQPPVLGGPDVLAESGVREPSGIAYHAGLDRLFVVGDEGRVAELDLSGRVLGGADVKGDLEDVAVHSSGKLLLIAETRARLIWYDPIARAEIKRWKLDVAGLLGEPRRDKNNGFEGLAFREERGIVGGGILYLIHQRAPAKVVEIAFDPEALAAGEVLDGRHVLRTWAVKKYRDLTAATWVAETGGLAVIADHRDRLLLFDAEGRRTAAIPLPGRQQEGLAFDREGTLWVADEQRGLLRFRGARGRLSNAASAPVRSTPP